jgi:hypothetical protein
MLGIVIAAISWSKRGGPGVSLTPRVLGKTLEIQEKTGDSYP